MSINAVHSVLLMLRKVFPYLNFRSNGYRIKNIVCSVSVPRLQCINVEHMYKRVCSTHDVSAVHFPRADLQVACTACAPLCTFVGADY